MGYLAKAKLVCRQNANDLTEERSTNLTKNTKKLCRTIETPFDELRTNYAESKPKHQGVMIPTQPNTVPRLPWQLERLVSAASSDQLSGFTFDGVLDINNYVRAWACAYLVGDQQHALDRLNQVQVLREANS